VSILFICIAVASVIGMSVAHIWLVVAAFRTSIGWGVITLLVPSLGNLLFIIFKWQRAAKPFLVYLGSLLCLIGSVWLKMTFAPESTEIEKKQTVTTGGALTGSQVHKLYKKKVVKLTR